MLLNAQPGYLQRAKPWPREVGSPLYVPAGVGKVCRCKKQWSTQAGTKVVFSVTWLDSRTEPRLIQGGDLLTGTYRDIFGWLFLNNCSISSCRTL